MERGNELVFPLLSKITAFKEHHLQLPGKLYSARLALADVDRSIGMLKKRLGDAQGAVKDSENEVALEVAGATLALTPAELEKGIAPKPAFTNETARKAEAQRRLKGQPAYQELVKAAAAIEDEIFQAEHARRLRTLDVEKLEDEQRALRAYTDLTGCETQLLSLAR